MKLLPSLLEQNVDRLNAKINYLHNNIDIVINETNQKSLALCVNFIYPHYALYNNLPPTISPILSIEVANVLIQYPLTVHANYLVNADEFNQAIPIGDISFLPSIWKVYLYLPAELYTKFKNQLSKQVEIGAIIYLANLSQDLITDLKTAGCSKFSLFGRHLLKQKEVEEFEITTIVNIIHNNKDVDFILNTEIEELINLVKQEQNLQICINQSYWNTKKII